MNLLASEKKQTRDINKALRAARPVVMSVGIDGVDTTRQVRITEYRAKRNGKGFEGRTISTGLWYDSARVWEAV